MNNSGFKVRLEAKIKNAKLIGARELAGLNCKEASERIGIRYGSYLDFEFMRRYPSKEVQSKICDFYRNSGIFLLEEEVFPDELNKTRIRRKYVAEMKIPKEDLISLDTADRKLLPYFDGERQIESFYLKKEVDEILSTLPYREEQVIRMRFEEDMSLEEVGEKFNVTKQRIRQIEAKALRKLRHPSRSRKLKTFLDEFLK